MIILFLCVCVCVCLFKQTIARAIVSRHTCHVSKKSIKKQSRHKIFKTRESEREREERAKARSFSPRVSRNESEEEEEKEERRLLFGKSFALSARAFYFSRALLKRYKFS